MPEEVQKQDRSGLWILGVIIVLMIGFGIWQIRYQLFTEDRAKQQIIAQIQEKIGSNANTIDKYLSNSTEGESLTALQNKDTDADGINDFQEQYIYTTSPYLSDSDSDTISDIDEITAGTNPNCPEGDSCTQERTNTNTVSIDAESALAGLTSAQIAQISEQVTPAQLRVQLRSSGVSETELAKLTDDQLMQLFQQSLKEESVTTQDAIDAQAASIRAMSIDQKKSLLIESGIDSKTVAALSTEQINALVEQAIQDAYTAVTGINANVSNTNASSNTNS